ncbi:hypothetical protein C8Q80DRAFT_914807 [Daedaleopsis nitida]|nr:hypothetical protein C8Q80DRAFT_914807 [Daedaleopsis nitida]
MSTPESYDLTQASHSLLLAVTALGCRAAPVGSRVKQNENKLPDMTARRDLFIRSFVGICAFYSPPGQKKVNILSMAYDDPTQPHKLLVTGNLPFEEEDKEYIKECANHLNEMIRTAASDNKFMDHKERCGHQSGHQDLTEPEKKLIICVYKKCFDKFCARVMKKKNSNVCEVIIGLPRNNEDDPEDQDEAKHEDETKPKNKAKQEEEESVDLQLNTFIHGIASIVELAKTATKDSDYVTLHKKCLHVLSSLRSSVVSALLNSSTVQDPLKPLGRGAVENDPFHILQS